MQIFFNTYSNNIDLWIISFVLKLGYCILRIYKLITGYIKYFLLFSKTYFFAYLREMVSWEMGHRIIELAYIHIVKNIS